MSEEKTMVIVLGSGFDYEMVRKKIDDDSNISDWVNTIQNTFIIRTTLDTGALFNLISSIDSKIPHSQFLIIEAMGRYSGLMPETSWDIFISFDRSMYYKEREPIEGMKDTRRKQRPPKI
jgi:hypothetical protein